MWEHIKEIILVCLAIVGIIWIIKQIILLFVKDNKDKKYSIIVPINKNSEDIEFTIRCIATRLKWSGTKFGNIICINYDADPLTLDICKTLEKDMPFLKIIDKNNIQYLSNFI